MNFRRSIAYECVYENEYVNEYEYEHELRIIAGTNVLALPDAEASIPCTYAHARYSD